MNPSNIIKLLVGLLLVVPFSKAQDANNRSSQYTEMGGGLVIVNVRPQRMPEKTIFGINYSKASEMTMPSAEVQSTKANQKTKQQGAQQQSEPNRVTAPVINKAKDVFLNYKIALTYAPIEMLLPKAVIVEGRAIPVGSAFSFILPLSAFTGVKKTQQSTAGKGTVTSVVENPADKINVLCTFVVRRIIADQLTLQVIPDKNYPADSLIIQTNFNEATSVKTP